MAKDMSKSNVASGSVPVIGVSQESSNTSAPGPMSKYSPILNSGHVYREIPSSKLPKGK